MGRSAMAARKASFVLVLLAACALLGDAGRLPTRLRIGGLFPMIGKTGNFDNGGLQRKAAFELAVRLINQDTDLLEEVTLETASRDSQRDAGNAFFGALQLCQDEGAVAIVGSTQSGPTKNAALVTKEFQVPLISYSATSSALSDKATYPTFARTVPPDGYQAAGLAWLSKHKYGWNRVGLLYNASGFGTDGAADFQRAAARLGIEVVAPQVFDLGDGPDEIKPHLQALRSENVRVILIFANAESAGQAFLAAKDLRMLGPNSGYQWLLSDGSLQPTAWTGPFAEVLPLLRGSIGLRPRVDTSNEAYTSFLASWSQRAAGVDYPDISWQKTSFDGTTYSADPASRFLYNEQGTKNAGTLVQFDSSGATTIDTYAPYAADAVYAIAYALQDVLTSRKAEVEVLTDDAGDFLSAQHRKTFAGMLFEKLRDVDFSGRTGRVTFNELYDRLMGYDIFNIVEGDTVAIAQWDPYLNYHSEVQQITWPDGKVGAENAPLDSPSIEVRYAGAASKGGIEAECSRFRRNGFL